VPTHQIVARWTDWTATGAEHLVLDVGADSITADGVVLSSGAAERFAARYRVVCDAAWRVRSVRVELIGAGAPRLALSADGEGHWLDGSANPLPHLDGAIDIDLSISPFTNTLPIRRVDPPPLESVEIAAAYIRVPELTVTRDPQRYTCLQARARYRYESLDSDFVRDIETDADGLVVTYPGLFRRIS
jgi:hypothetical protein